MTYDVIVVGARVAGSATSMLLARRGLNVLAVDRAAFPSDTLSTHQVQVPGAAALARWGLLDRLVEAGTPPARRVRFDPGPVVLEGRYPELEGADAIYSPRRTLLDALLVDAAREAGAEVRENVIVEDLVWDGDRVCGVRVREKNGPETTETARLVVGADGRRSMVAERAGAASVDELPSRTMACYTYFSGVPLDGGEIYGRPSRAAGAWPTNDGLVITFLSWPIDEFDAFRSDPEGNVLRTLDLAGDLGERVRAGERVERIRITPETNHRVRVPYGPGWALVGDAGLVMDPISGQGIGNAFREAELVAGAVADGLGGAALARGGARGGGAGPRPRAPADVRVHEGAGRARADAGRGGGALPVAPRPAGGDRPVPRRDDRLRLDARLLHARQPPAGHRPSRDGADRPREDPDPREDRRARRGVTGASRTSPVR